MYVCTYSTNNIALEIEHRGMLVLASKHRDINQQSQKKTVD